MMTKGCVVCGNDVPATWHPRYVCCNGRDCGCYGAMLPANICSTQCYENEAWNEREEDGPLDLEDQLENALDRAFPSAKA